MPNEKITITGDVYIQTFFSSIGRAYNIAIRRLITHSWCAVERCVAQHERWGQAQEKCSRFCARAREHTHFVKDEVVACCRFYAKKLQISIVLRSNVLTVLLYRNGT